MLIHQIISSLMCSFANIIALNVWLVIVLVINLLLCFLSILFINFTGLYTQLSFLIFRSFLGLDLPSLSLRLFYAFALHQLLILL